MNYVLVTAAYNEEKYIERTLRSVVSQTLRPVKWVIVSDGSTDRTDEIVLRYAAEHDFIELLRVTEDHPRNFAAQVNAINLGVKRLANCHYDFIGNVDSDISFAPEYFARLLAKFAADGRLGLAGGFIHEEVFGEFKSRIHNSTQAVAHAVQLFRREAFEQFGGYVPLWYGGPDWHAEVTVRMHGWRVESFPDLPVLHYRPAGAAGGFVRSCFRQGRMDRSVGSHPLFEAVKIARRIWGRAPVVGALARLAGYLYESVFPAPSLVSEEFVQFLRKEQVERLRSLWPPREGVIGTSPTEL